MKRFFYLSVLVILSSLNSCKKANVENGVNEKFAIMTFTKSEYDFGTINQGDKVETEFPFTNTGKIDLLITNAKGSCGCTIPDFPKKPIKPGEKGKIKVAFNSAGKSGKQMKSITIMANTPTSEEKLKINVTILKKPGISK